MRQIKRALYEGNKIVAFVVESMSGKSIVVTNNKDIDLEGKVRNHTKINILVVEDEVFSLMTDSYGTIK